MMSLQKEQLVVGVGVGTVLQLMYLGAVGALMNS